MAQPRLLADLQRDPRHMSLLVFAYSYVTYSSVRTCAIRVSCTGRDWIKCSSVSGGQAPGRRGGYTT
jgi:hypothetical protein